MHYFYWDEEKEMVLVKPFKNWIDNEGEGDALWRTAIAYITTGDKKYYNGILKTFRVVPKFTKNGYVDNYHYQACRCNPEISEDDVSRDQVIMAWTSLYLNGDERKLKELVQHTKYRLSKRYLMTPTMWLWSKGLIGNNFLGYIGQFFLMIELSFSVVWNSIIKKLIGYEDFSSEELENMMKEQSLTEPWREKGEELRNEFLDKKWKINLWKANFPGYGLHLASWMNYTSKDSIFKEINNLLIKTDMSKHNLLLKLLTGGEVIDEIIEQIEPREEWIWSSRFDKGKY